MDFIDSEPWPGLSLVCQVSNCKVCMVVIENNRFVPNVKFFPSAIKQYASKTSTFSENFCLKAIYIKRLLLSEKKECSHNEEV